MQDYTPIDCDFYDRLEEAATLKQRVRLFLGTEEQADGVITDLVQHDDAEWVRMGDGREIRLDHVEGITLLVQNS